MTTQQIKEIDSKCLNDYLATLPHTDHRFIMFAECINYMVSCYPYHSDVLSVMLLLSRLPSFLPVHHIDS